MLCDCSAGWAAVLLEGPASHLAIRSLAKVEKSETAGSKAAAVQLAFMFAVALIFSVCAFYGSVEEKASSEVRGHCVNQTCVLYRGLYSTCK